ncbi:hypothetical protein [Neptunitalea lumnitzerae]|uniref:Uncharacterized protein n=1 Tax=Neptunitalea lumnitzerae TaxID=2965509 RepID=A0ABQ5MKC6_9FLAO|nr:hypothetical protein [Neptunitalea sp. Y10]GLB49849.1 hypothetical protein Y10_22170 [Neptunitalea sp. Y10]
MEDGTKVGESLTTHSFVANGKAVKGTVIDTYSSEGACFIENEIIGADPEIIPYMWNGRGNKPYDFKTRDIKENKGEQSALQYMYRGSMTSDGKMASARDFGNLGAGIVAGRFGLGWGGSRFGFDALQSWQDSRLERGYLEIGDGYLSYIFFNFTWSVEGIPTQKAQYIGWLIGVELYNKDIEKLYQPYKAPANQVYWTTYPYYRP